MPLHAFCRQISSQEFEEQRLTVSQTAIAELLDLLLADSSLAGKERRKKLRLVHTHTHTHIPLHTAHQFSAPSLCVCTRVCVRVVPEAIPGHLLQKVPQL